MPVLGEVCLESLGRGGINVSVGEVGEEQGRRSFAVAMEVFWREIEQERGAPKGIKGGRRRSFIASRRIASSLDAGEMDPGPYTCLQG
jgi:hypothetical protein